jgi:hypothetical protein
MKVGMVACSHLFHYFENNEKYPGAWTNDPGGNLVLGKIQRDLKSGIKKGPFYKKFLK